LSSAQKPFVIGLAGGTGSGKTTIAQRIAAGLPAAQVALLEHDSYYRDLSHLTEDERALVNFDHPDALETALLVEHLSSLRAGHGVEIPRYDFGQHVRRPETQPLMPCPLVLVEGILVLSDERLRAQFDLKIFVDTDADLRLLRRLGRDIEQRGRSFDSVREQYFATVRPMHLAYVEPSKRWADVIVPEGGDNRAAIELIVGKVQSIVASR